MRAGKLDRQITIERSTEALNDHGTSAETWTPIAAVRAQLVEASTEEFRRAYGTSSDTVTIFRIRFVDGVTLGDRVAYGEQHHNIKEIKEIGRRRGLELRTVSEGAP